MNRREFVQLGGKAAVVAALPIPVIAEALPKTYSFVFSQHYEVTRHAWALYAVKKGKSFEICLSDVVDEATPEVIEYFCDTAEEKLSGWHD